MSEEPESSITCNENGVEIENIDEIISSYEYVTDKDPLNLLLWEDKVDEITGDDMTALEEARLDVRRETFLLWKIISDVVDELDYVNGRASYSLDHDYAMGPTLVAEHSID